MRKRYFWILGSIAFFLFITIPLLHLLRTKWKEVNLKVSTPIGFANDASLLNLTPIDTVIRVPNDTKEIVDQLKQVLNYARQNNLKVSIAGAQHSMGGHTIYPKGVLINMLPYNHMELDTVQSILEIGSGALWTDAIRYIDKYHKSIAVMQAFSSFSVGGSLSVNGHGWQKNLPPISSSVISFTLMNSDGEILTCSENENIELYRLALGGYGLFGIILDVRLKVVDNQALEYQSMKLSTDNYLDFYDRTVTNNDKAELVFGRLRISEKNFLNEVMLNFFERTSKTPIPLNEDKDYEAKRLIFRGSVDSEFGKRLRWNLESIANNISEHLIFSRNNLLNDQVSLIENRDTLSTDILHEYFIPERNFNRFINEIKSILRQSDIDLLNITIRRVEEDSITIMNYARETVYGFVFLFNQKKTDQQEQSMQLLTNQLVDITIKNEGTFYLPYRLHIDRDKMRRVYPQADRFFELKRKYDPEELFNNKFYQHYK